jgi:GTPase SAR1 family protein
MSSNKAATPCKVVLLGESGKINPKKGVGKSSVIARYINDTFQTNNMSTTGASFAAKSMFYDQYDRNLKFEVKNLYFK